VRLALTEDWFTIFSANAAHLGRIDADISHRIIACYALLKALIEEFRINNDYLLTFAEIEREQELSGNWIEIVKQSLSVSERKKQIQAILVAQFARIQNSEQALKTAVNELFAVLDERGIK